MAKYPELAGIEIMLKSATPDEEQLKMHMSVFEQVYEMGYERGKTDAMLDAMFGEEGNIWKSMRPSNS